MRHHSSHTREINHFLLFPYLYLFSESQLLAAWQTISTFAKKCRQTEKTEKGLHVEKKMIYEILNSRIHGYLDLETQIKLFLAATPFVISGLLPGSRGESGIFRTILSVWAVGLNFSALPISFLTFYLP